MSSNSNPMARLLFALLFPAICVCWVNKSSRNPSLNSVKNIHHFAGPQGPCGASTSTCTRMFVGMTDESYGGWGPYADDEDDFEVQHDEERLSDEELEATLESWDNKIAAFNSVHLVGRVGQDPEARHFDDGKVVVNLSLACTRKYHSLERKELNLPWGDEETDWYGLEIWGQTAEFCQKYVDRGARIGVIGSLQIDQWTDSATNEPRQRAKVVVRDLDILETKAEAEARRGNRRGPSFYKNDDDDDDDDYRPSAGGSGGFFS